MTRRTRLLGRVRRAIIVATSAYHFILDLRDDTSVSEAIHVPKSS